VRKDPTNRHPGFQLTTEEADDAGPPRNPLVTALALVLLVAAIALFASGVGLFPTSARPATDGRVDTPGSPPAGFQFPFALPVQAQPTPQLDLVGTLARLVLAAILGGVISFRGSRRRNEFLIVHTNMMIAMTGALMMIIVGSDLARAFGLVGASSIARYRTPVNDPKALASLFVSMGAGIAVGVGLYELAILAAMLVILVEFTLERGGRLISRGWYRPERAYELNVETETPEETLVTVREVLDASGITHTLMDYERGKKDVKVTLTLGVPEGVDTEKVTLRILSAGANAVNWRATKDV
jgi:uncharacterized membrane protein YhiD involved in acid resistance